MLRIIGVIAVYALMGALVPAFVPGDASENAIRVHRGGFADGAEKG